MTQGTFIKLFVVIFVSLIGSSASMASIEEKIQGKWTTGFVADPSGYWQFRASIAFSSGKIKWTSDVLIDHPLGKSAARDEMVGTYLVGNPLETPDGAHEFDIVFNTFLHTPLHFSNVEEYNEESYCGLKDWKLGVTRDITGLECEGFPMQEAGETYLDIVGMGEIGGVERVLFGESDEGNGVGNTTRPIAYDLTRYFTRKGGHQPPLPEPGQGKDLTGFYRIISDSVNLQSCEAEGPVLSEGATHFELYKNETIFPGMFGYSLQTCDSVEDCAKKTNQFYVRTNWPIHVLETSSEGQESWGGIASDLTWTGECYAKLVEANHQIGLDNSIYHESREYSGVVSKITTKEDCAIENPVIKEAMTSLNCSNFRVMKSEFISKELP